MSEVLVSIHGKRLGIDADGNLLLDGVVVAGTRSTITTVVTGLSAAGSIALTGAAIGDVVTSVINLSTPADDSSDFESAITVAGHIQQTSATDLSASKFLVSLVPRS